MGRGASFRGTVAGGHPDSPRGNVPWNGVAVEPSNNRVFIAVQDGYSDGYGNSATIAVLDGNTNTVSPTRLHPPLTPATADGVIVYGGQFGFDPARHRLYTGGSYRVHALDTTTNAYIASGPAVTCGLNCPLPQIGVNTVNQRLFSQVDHVMGYLLELDGTTLAALGPTIPLKASDGSAAAGMGIAVDSVHPRVYLAASKYPYQGPIVVLNGTGTQVGFPPATGSGQCEGAYSVAVNTTTQRVYVTTRRSGSFPSCLGVVDGPTNTAVVPPIVLPDSAVDAGPLVVDEAQNRVYISTQAGGLTFDGNTNTVVGSPLPTGVGWGVSIAFNPALRRLYAGGYDANSLAVIAVDASPTPTPTPHVAIQGDGNGDGHVNFQDFFMLIDNWGKTGAGNAVDFNHDGVVDFQDFFALIDHWGK